MNMMAWLGRGCFVAWHQEGNCHQSVIKLVAPTSWCTILYLIVPN